MAGDSSGGGWGDASEDGADSDGEGFGVVDQLVFSKRGGCVGVGSRHQPPLTEGGVVDMVGSLIAEQLRTNPLPPPPPPPPFLGDAPAEPAAPDGDQAAFSMADLHSAVWGHVAKRAGIHEQLAGLQQANAELVAQVQELLVHGLLDGSGAPPPAAERALPPSMAQVIMPSGGPLVVGSGRRPRMERGDSWQFGGSTDVTRAVMPMPVLPLERREQLYADM